MKNELIYTVSTVPNGDRPGQGFVAKTLYIQKRKSALATAADIIGMKEDAEIAHGWQIRQNHWQYGYWRGLWYGERAHNNGTRTQVLIKTPRYRWAELLVWSGIASAAYDDATGTIDPAHLAAALTAWRASNAMEIAPVAPDADDAQYALHHEDISEAFMIAVAAVAAGMIVG